MSSSAGDFCSNRLWATPKPVENLERKLILTNGSTLLVDYATKDQLPVCYEMIQEAARRGDNVGTDEFGSYDEVNAKLFSISEIFQVRDPSTNQAKAFLSISPCPYARGFYTCIASVCVIRQPDIDDVTWARLVKLATQLVEVIDVGYTQCVVDVALCHSQLIRLLRDEAGFHVTAIIPHCVNISGVGLYWNAILARQLDIPDRPVKTFEEILERAEKLHPEIETNEKYQSSTPRQLDFLPQKYVFNNGTRAIVRHMRKEEDVVLYEMMKDAMEHGEGYGVSEHPTLASFRGKCLLQNDVCFGVEEESTGEIIAYQILFKASMVRSRQVSYVRTLRMVSKKFRGKRFGAEVLIMAFGISRDIGYQYGLNNTTIGNDGAVTHTQHLGIQFVGTLQKGVYFTGQGWVDMAITAFDLCRNFKSFKQLVQENA